MSVSPMGPAVLKNTRPGMTSPLTKRSVLRSAFGSRGRALTPVRLDSCPKFIRELVTGQGQSGRIARKISGSGPARDFGERLRMDHEEVGRLWNGNAEAWT